MEFITRGILVILFTQSVWGQDWSVNATLPGEEVCRYFEDQEVCLTDGNRENIFDLSKSELKNKIYEGSKHALHYPIEVTGLKLPFNPLRKYFESDANSLFRRIIFKFTKLVSKFKTFDDFFGWMGLSKYPVTPRELGPNVIADMGEKEKYHMGVTVDYSHHGKYLTFSCASCHSADLFGTKVLGMTNRFPRANEIFVMGQQILGKVPTSIFKIATGATSGETKIYDEAKSEIIHIGVVEPKALGLDTSLAQVSLSLAKRNQDEYATKNKKLAMKPRANGLDKNPADSKPAVWWNLKYKTRWLSDGSIVSGNPIYTNFLWNEIGRGVDLKVLEKWLVENQVIVENLTAYVFATKAPKFNDFFPNKIDIDLAQRGQQLFQNNCTSCHGYYEKGWENGAITYEDQIETTKVWYHKTTPIKNVGTDRYRAKGMTYFANELNNLKISKTIGTVVESQNGYVPPPLVGIWARWPYFHNNSVPTLYDVLTPDFNRPSKYIAVPATYKDSDFDIVKNGYPPMNEIRKEFRKDREYLFDTKVKGLSNKGHTTMILIDRNGNERFSHQDKLSIIEFLKTL